MKFKSIRFTDLGAAGCSQHVGGGSKKMPHSSTGAATDSS